MSLIMQDKFHSFHSVATILSYLTKAPLVSLFACINSGIAAPYLAPIQPLIFSYNTKPERQVPPGTPVVNALAKQRAMLENIMRACVGLAPENNMILEYK